MDSGEVRINEETNLIEDVADQAETARQAKMQHRQRENKAAREEFEKTESEDIWNLLQAGDDGEMSGGKNSGENSEKTSERTSKKRDGKKLNLKKTKTERKNEKREKGGGDEQRQKSRVQLSEEDALANALNNLFHHRPRGRKTSGHFLHKFLEGLVYMCPTHKVKSHLSGRKVIYTTQNFKY
jgi:hypothetical protein